MPLELQYPYEAGKVTVPAGTIVDELTPSLELAQTDPPSALVCDVAAELDWTRDPFDRLITAQAIATTTPLVTKDRTIRSHSPLAWWGDAGPVTRGQ